MELPIRHPHIPPPNPPPPPPGICDCRSRLEFDPASRVRDSQLCPVIALSPPGKDIGWCFDPVKLQSFIHLSISAITALGGCKSGFYDAEEVHRLVVHQGRSGGALAEILQEIQAATTSALQNEIIACSDRGVELIPKKSNEAKTKALWIRKKYLQALLLLGKHCVLWRKDRRIAEGKLMFSTFLCFTVDSRLFQIDDFRILSGKYCITESVFYMNFLGTCRPVQRGMSETCKGPSVWERCSPIFTTTEPCLRGVRYQKDGRIYYGVMYIPSRISVPLAIVEVVWREGFIEVPISDILGPSGFEKRYDFPAVVKEKLTTDDITCTYEVNKDSPPVLKVKSVRGECATVVDMKSEHSDDWTDVSPSEPDEVSQSEGTCKQRCDSFELQMVAVPT